MITDDERGILEATLAELKVAHKRFEFTGQKNQAAITRDDICWIEIKLGLNDPNTPLIPRAEITLQKERNAKRMGIVDEILNNLDTLIRHDMDYAGPRKYQNVVKVCSLAEKVRFLDDTQSVDNYSDRLHIHADDDLTLNMGIGDVGMMNRLAGAGHRVLPAAPPTPLQDMSRVLADYLDKAQQVAGDRSSANRASELDSLLGIRERLTQIPTVQREQLDVIDRRIADVIATLEQQEKTDDPNASRADSPADPEVVLSDVSRRHSLGGDERGELRSGHEQALAGRGEGDRDAGGDRREEEMVELAAQAGGGNGVPVGTDRQGGEAAPEAAQAGADDDHGGAIRRRGDGGGPGTDGSTGFSRASVGWPNASDH